MLNAGIIALMVMAGTNLSNIFTRSEQIEVQRDELSWQQTMFMAELLKNDSYGNRGNNNMLPLLFILGGFNGGSDTPPPTPTITEKVENIIESPENPVYKAMDWATAGNITKTSEILGTLWGNITYDGAEATKSAFGYEPEVIKEFYLSNPVGNFFNDVVVPDLGYNPITQLPIKYVPTQNDVTVIGGESISNALKEDAYMVQGSVVSSNGSWEDWKW